jgi:hypothetical protein
MLNKYAFVSPIAMVSSFFPNAMLPEGDRFSVHAFVAEKSSSNKIFPRLGRISTVGVMIEVGKAVGVTVGGNQMIVGVTEAVGADCVSVGSGIVVGAAEHEQHKIPNKQ